MHRHFGRNCNKTQVSTSASLTNRDHSSSTAVMGWTACALRMLAAETSDRPMPLISPSLTSPCAATLHHCACIVEPDAHVHMPHAHSDQTHVHQHHMPMLKIAVHVQLLFERSTLPIACGVGCMWVMHMLTKLMCSKRGQRRRRAGHSHRVSALSSRQSIVQPADALLYASDREEVEKQRA